MSSWHVYLLRCKDNSLYTGVTTDIERRVKEHNAGVGAKYTRARLPITLVWSEEAPSESIAKKREAEIKRWPKTKKETLI